MPDTYTTYLNGRVVSRGVRSLAMAESAAKIKVMTCKLRFSTAVIVSALIGRIERVIIDDANGCRSFDPNETTAAATLPLSPSRSPLVLYNCERCGKKIHLPSNFKPAPPILCLRCEDEPVASGYPTAAGVVCRCHERTGFCPAHGPTGPDPDMQV